MNLVAKNDRRGTVRRRRKSTLERRLRRSGFCIFTLGFAALIPGALPLGHAQEFGSSRDGLDTSVDSVVRDVAVQDDGKILIAGDFGIVEGASRYRIARLNSEGFLDETFVPDIDSLVAFTNVNAMAIQSDGKIVITGNFTSIGGETRNNIARLHPDGSLDLDFNPNLTGEGKCLALQDDGRILVGGYFTSVGGEPRSNLARLNPDGTIDESFTPDPDQGVEEILVRTDQKILVGGGFQNIGGTDHKILALLDSDGSVELGFDPDIDPLSGGINPVQALAVQDDGKILIGGFFQYFGDVERPRLARLNEDGSLDDGFVPPVPDATIRSIVVQEDSRILIGGDFFNLGGDSGRLRLARLLPGGSVDPSFTATPANIVTDLELLGDGKILVGGFFSSISGVFQSCFARLHEDGGAETSFNPGSGSIGPISVQRDGKIILGGNFYTDPIAHGMTRLDDGRADPSFLVSESGFVRAIAIQRDGDILIGGQFTSIGGVSRTLVARLDEDGNLDPDFNPVLDAGATSVYSLVVQADGKILIAGDFTSIGGIGRDGFARLQPDGSPDLDFVPDVPPGTLSAILVQPDGRILVGGNFTTVGGVARDGMARLNADSTLDTGFNPSIDSPVSCFVLQPDGKIVVGGVFTSLNGSPRNKIGRLNEDGTTDPGFDPGLGQNVPRVDCLALQADGRILVGGFFFGMGGQVREDLAMLDGDGVADEFFDPNPNDNVRSFSLDADGNILVHGSFTNIGGYDRPGIARLNNQPATQNLDVAGAGTRLTWTRGGSSGVVESVSFEVSTDMGAVWTPLGDASRIDNSSVWELTGLNLPFEDDFLIRSTGYQMSSIVYNGGASVYESIHPLYLDALPPSPVVNPVDNSASKRVISKKLGTLKKKFKKAKSNKQVSKVKKLKGLIRKLTKQLRAL